MIAAKLRPMFDERANAANQHHEPSVKKLTEPKDDNSSRAQAKAAGVNGRYVKK
jgi:hypothetical protein